MKYTLNLKKLQKQIALIDTISDQSKWKVSYDEETDSLYFSPDIIPDGFSLFSVNDDFSVFVNEKSDLGGIFIEYYKSNLTSHDKKFKPFKSFFMKQQTNKSKQQLEEKTIQFTEVLKAELLSELALNKKSSIVIPA